jgi:hypothetical protein
MFANELFYCLIADYVHAKFLSSGSLKPDYYTLVEVWERGSFLLSGSSSYTDYFCSNHCGIETLISYQLMMAAGSHIENLSSSLRFLANPLDES